MIEFVGASLGVLGYLYVKELFAGLPEHEVISRNLKDCQYIKSEKTDAYTLYLYRASYGVDYKLDKITERIKCHLGKHVRVEFDKLIKVYVYSTELPKKVLLPIFEEQDNSKVAIGVGREGIVYHDFTLYSHIVIAGHTGYGKTTLINSIIPQLDGEIYLFDLKDSKKDYAFASARSIDEAVEVFQEIEQRFKEPKDKPIFVIIDEAQELQVPDYITKREEKKPYLYCQEMIGKIGSQGRSNKIWLIYATQYPTADIIPKFVKQNAETRISFRLPTLRASEVALDEGGAEKLPRGQRGRVLYKTDQLEEVQTFIAKGVKEVVTKVRTTEKTRSGDIIEIGEGTYHDGGTTDEDKRWRDRG